jgi:beta-glucanase (GH16 family)
VTVSATASDNVGVAGVQFQLDGMNLGAEDTASPYSVQWDTTGTPNGSHTITAVARDAAGNLAASSAVAVTVDNIPDTTAPAVALSAPADGSSVSNTVGVTATASDNVGVSGVKFLLDGAPLGAEDTSSPYSTSWDTRTTTNGPHVLSAVARDAAGNTANAPDVSISVDNGSGGLAFDEEFNGTTVDTNAWFVMNRHGDYSNNELQCYRPANVAEAGGLLTITTQVHTATCGDATHSPSSWNYTSGMIQWKTFNFKYGTIEMRAKLAGGQGPWPALWLLGTNCQVSNETGADNFGGCNWPSPGSDEIDITEILGAMTSVNQAIHTTQGSYRCTATTSDVSQNWHVYDLVWSPGKLVWHIDGVATCTITTAVPSTPMFLIINTAVAAGGSSVNDSTLPQTLSVDYVRVTTSGTADTQPPTAPTNLSAATSGRNADLAWSPATDNIGVARYNVYRSATANFQQGAANLIGQSTSTSYTDTTASGTVYYKVTAQDAAGNVGAASNEATATLPVDTTFPAVSMTAPADGAAVTGAVGLSATASDDFGVVGVQFLLDGNNLGTEDTTGPYSLSWDSVTAANGPHRLSARARDAAGHATTSADVNVTVNNPVGTSTVDFNNRTGNSNLNGQYPTGVIDWGSNVWWVATPWGQFTTNSISFNRSGLTSGTFTFVNPKRLVSIKAYNGGTAASTVTLSCAGNTTVTQAVSSGQLVTISTGWTVGCSTVTVGSSNGWDTNLDDVVYN